MPRATPAPAVPATATHCCPPPICIGLVNNSVNGCWIRPFIVRPKLLLASIRNMTNGHEREITITATRSLGITFFTVYGSNGPTSTAVPITINRPTITIKEIAKLRILVQTILKLSASLP